MAGREFDAVVFGATGVTGRRVAAHLSRQERDHGIRWAAAARDSGKLERILAEDGVEGARTIEADVSDPDSLAAMTARTGSLLNLVGPYTLHARPVMAACVQNGANYLDLTGEIPFVRRMIDEFDGAARNAGVKVIQVCGFEALPPDLAVLLAATTARERLGEGLASADVEVWTKPPPGLPRGSDVISGGTLQSMAEVTGGEGAESVTDPAVLVDDPSSRDLVRVRSPIRVEPRRADGGAVIAPMTPAAFINPAVIQRTAALAAEREGRRFEPFRYREGIAIRGPGVTLPLRFGVAAALSGVQAAMGAATRARPAIRQRAAAGMRAIFPGSGFGPQGDRVEGWRWGLTVNALTTGGSPVRVDLEADGHPGYLTTARMIAEAGLLVAEEGATPEGAGCLTPAIAVGAGSAARFERAGMRFAVSS